MQPARAPSLPLQVLALFLLAGVAALLSNQLATPARRLAWVRRWKQAPAAPKGEVSKAEPLPSLPLDTPPIVPVPAPAPEPKAPPSAPRKPLATLAPLPAPAPPAPPSAAVASPLREITTGEAWAAFQAGAPFLDARRSAEYAMGHIRGAWCTPVWEADLEDRLFTFKAQRRPGPDDPIVLYCSGGDCRDSHLLAEKLLGEGYFHLLIYRDGYPGWVAAGHPVEKGQP